MTLILLYLAFFLSGAAGLFYESVWTRYLGLLVGHDAHAQVIVLVIFLGGMSLGAALVARHTVRIARPLLAYAAIEAAVGVGGLLFHDLFVAVSEVAYTSLFPALADTPWLGAAKWGLAGLLILPMSILLGTTFPLMSAAVVRARPGRPGNVLSWLYFTNSLGGAIGVLLAGFVVLRMAGMPGVLAAAAALNLAVAVVALVAERGLGAVPASPPPQEAPGVAAAAPPVPFAVLQPVLLGVAFGTAVASFAYEIDWIRMLALVLGSATHAFELMLSAFILGLALGALAIRRLDTLRSPLHMLGWVQVAMGILAILTLPVYVASFEWFTTLMAVVSRTDAAYTGFSVLRYALCLAVMLPSTICAGMTLPLITRSLLVGGGGEAAIGRVYAWNTLGAIVGVALASLVLLPGLGLKPMLLVAGGLDVALGLVIFTMLSARRRTAVASAVAVTVAGAVALTVPLDRALLTSGVFRSGTLTRATGAEVVYYADGRTATVAVGANVTGAKWISTNGKPDASVGPWWNTACNPGTVRRRLGGDEITQILLPLVTAAYHPQARRAAVIGFGSGMSSHVLLGIPAFEAVATIEIEPRMVEGARAFLPANARVYDDPRSTIVIGDAKAHFAGTRTQWDLILSEPSNPWVSGVAGLFTVEFYERVRATLAEGGVFGQWLHTYELSDALVLSVLAAIDAVFPSWQLHQVGPGDLLVVASASEQLPPLDAASVLSHAGVEADLCRFVPIAPSDLEALVVAGPELLRPVLTRIGQPNSDFYPTLDLGAEAARFKLSSARGVLGLASETWNLNRALMGGRGHTVIARDLPFDGVARVTDGWLRTGWRDAGPEADARLVRARWTVQQWEALRDARAAPVNWPGWLEAMATASRIVHAGTAGIADTAFFDEARAAAVRLAAPAGVVATIDLRRAVADWNVDQALRSANALEADSAVGSLVSAAEVLDGVVTLALRDGDTTTARHWFDALVARANRPVDSVWMMVLDGRVAGGMANPPTP